MNLQKITTYQAGTVQASMHRQLQQICDDVLRPYGITKMHWLIIGNILDAGPSGIRVGDLAEKLGTTFPYMTTTLKLLDSKGITSRASNSDDSRSKLVTISPDFKTKCDEIENLLRDKLRQTIYSEVNEADFETYIKVMYQLNSVGKKFTR